MPFDGLSPETLARRLRAPSCLALASVTSVMDVLHELAAAGAPGGAVVLADEQIAGRGRQGRAWHSLPGRGICLAYLVRPGRGIESGVFALRAGLAVAETLRELGVQVQLKWPNDVLADGRKLAGILCESRWQGANASWIAVGIGMNVQGPVAAEVADSAVALDELCAGATRLAVLEGLVPGLHAMSDEPRLSERERSRYARVDWLVGRRVQAPVSGVAEGLAPDGALLVNTGTGVERVVGGGVVAA